MGWVRESKADIQAIFNEITSSIVWRGTPKGNDTPYEYFSDYIRDYYDVSFRECDELCKMLRRHYGIEKFYASDKLNETEW